MELNQCLAWIDQVLSLHARQRQMACQLASIAGERFANPLAHQRKRHRGGMLVHRKNLWLPGRIIAFKDLEFWMNELSRPTHSRFDLAMNGQTLSRDQSIDQV